ncbi:MAG: hypothetical protein QOI34_743 [Verrucomicrobiota bacterium]
MLAICEKSYFVFGAGWLESVRGYLLEEIARFSTCGVTEPVYFVGPQSCGLGSSQVFFLAQG